MAKPLTPSQKAALAKEKARQAARDAKKAKPAAKPTPKPTPKPAAKPKPPAAKPTRPALPPGRPGGALATRPPTQSTRQANARAQLRDASRGSTGPNRVGQPAGSANRMYGANVVNNSVNRAIASTRLANLSKAAGGVALPAAIATQAMNVVGGFQKLANHPFLKGKDGKPTPSAGRRTNPNAAKPAKPKPQRQGPAVPARLANSPKPANLPKPTPKPKPSSATTPSRSSTPARPAASRPAASRPAATPAKAKPPAASKPTVAQTSGIGPVKSGAAYASKKGSISESVRQLREMRTASVRRQTGQAAPALSSSKDYSSKFKDMKGGSSRFAAELKKKKKGYKLF
jgi:branched-chain amino acid transport system ATP-binding protein